MLISEQQEQKISILRLEKDINDAIEADGYSVERDGHTLYITNAGDFAADVMCLRVVNKNTLEDLTSMNDNSVILLRFLFANICTNDYLRNKITDILGEDAECAFLTNEAVIEVIKYLVEISNKINKLDTLIANKGYISNKRLYDIVKNSEILLAIRNIQKVIKTAKMKEALKVV